MPIVSNTVQSTTQADGSLLRLRKLRAEHDVADRDAALASIQRMQLMELQKINTRSSTQPPNPIEGR